MLDNFKFSEIATLNFLTQNFIIFFAFIEDKH